MNTSYAAWIADLKRRWLATQIKAAVAVNSPLIDFCWDLGWDIAEDFAEESGYESRFFEKVSRDLQAEFPDDSRSSASRRRSPAAKSNGFFRPRAVLQNATPKTRHRW